MAGNHLIIGADGFAATLEPGTELTRVCRRRLVVIHDLEPSNKLFNFP